MQKHIQHNKDERTQFFRKIYISHLILERIAKGLILVMCESWVGDRTELQHIDPHSSDYHSLSFPFSWAAQPGAWGPSLCWDVVLIPASSLQLIWTSCRRGYIIIWRPPTSCERHNFTLNSTPRQSRLPLISWYLRYYLHRCISSFDSLAGSEVNMQHYWWKPNGRHLKHIL